MDLEGTVLKKEQTDVFGAIKLMFFMWMLIVMMLLLVRRDETVRAAKEAAKKVEASLKKQETVANTGEVPQYFQHDSKWGSEPYAGGTISDSGCGPTCLSMVVVHLTGDEKKTPKWMAEYSTVNGYIQDGKTAWTMMSEGAKECGINVVQMPKSEEKMKQALEEGKVIITSMGPGAFTKAGHFIVIAGYKDGAFVVNDPNSLENSEKKWKYDEFQDQIKNIWVYWK